ncbi:glycosyltransferase family 39 protein [Candidatus Microgenomates bacterium]|nr:glycosyltransferase family 39 protein [Candidatus Microgenomates bacterium]
MLKNTNFARVKRIIKTEYLILSVVLFLGLVLRLYRIQNPVADWHSWRQADTASVSREFVKNGINLLYPKYHDISSIQTGIPNPEGFRMVELPIYNAVHATLFNVFGRFSLEMWGRLTSVIFALISAVFLFLIGKKLYSTKIGILSSFFYLVLPYNIYFTRVILPESMGVCLSLAGIYFAILYLYKQKTANLVLFVVFFSLSLLVKPFFAFFLIPLAYLFKLKKLKLDRKILFSVVLTLLPFIMWRFWISNFPEGIPFFKWAFNGDKIRFHPAFFRWLFGERLGILILGGWGLVPFVFGLVKKENNKFSLWFIVSMLAYVTVVATASIRHDYYQIMAIPAIVLVLSLGVVELWKKSKLLVVLSILVMMLVSWDRIRPFYQINHPEIIEVGKIVDETLPLDALIIAPYIGDTAFLYQTNRWGWPAIDDSIDNIIERGADYYVSVDLQSLDTVNFEKRFKTLLKTDMYIILDLHKENIK